MELRSKVKISVRVVRVMVRVRAGFHLQHPHGLAGWLATSHRMVAQADPHL